MAVTYGPHLQAIWRTALCLPNFDTLEDSLAFEVGEYRGLSLGEAKDVMRDAWASRTERMRKELPKSLSDDGLQEYYKHQSVGVLASAYWHSLLPDRYALHSVSGLHALQHFCEGNRVFEFGHGIGSTAILLARHGFEVIGGDISADYREFARQRVARRQLPIDLLDLSATEPADAAFDAVVSFDVLEHTASPLEHVARMHRWLRPGGVMVLNIAFGRDPANPEHIQPYRFGVLDRIRALGFERIPWPTLYVFAKQPLGGARKLVYRAQDALAALGEDLGSKTPRGRRLVRTTSLPPLG